MMETLEKKGEEKIVISDSSFGLSVLKITRLGKIIEIFTKKDYFESKITGLFKNSFNIFALDINGGVYSIF